LDDLLLGLIWYIVLLFSLTLHEAGHAWAAQRGGDPTAYLGGQVSLDPRPHIKREPFGTVVWPLISYSLNGSMIGWASTPYSVAWAERYPRRAAWMSLAGPAANLLIVIASGLAIRAGIAAGVFDAPAQISFTQLVVATSAGLFDTIAVLLSIAFTLNLLLLVFNLIPLPPLDGAGAVGLLVSESTAIRLRQLFSQPQFGMLGIVAAWFLIQPIFGPVHLLAVRILYPELSYG
jgi:Zn-dependent protease